MRPYLSSILLPFAMATSQMAFAEAPPTTSQSEPYEPAPISELIAPVDIPYGQFKLDNGLTVLVHEDRKAPVVGVSVWYGIGSKHEPKGKTGFAHLFEHLMFNGSENSPGDFFEPLQDVGATDFNGTTWFDRTNYFETVPTAALDRALMLESDRMGHLLGAVTQEKLDNQIGVVQNEKRQGDNQPYGLVEYEQLENLYPSGHPYHHSTIGSMDDLSGATLEDVKQWFRDNYGPNNAILVLAGDVDMATAQSQGHQMVWRNPRRPRSTPSRCPGTQLAGTACQDDLRPDCDTAPLPYVGGAGPRQSRLHPAGNGRYGLGRPGQLAGWTTAWFAASNWRCELSPAPRSSLRRARSCSMPTSSRAWKKRILPRHSMPKWLISLPMAPVPMNCSAR